MTLVVGVDNYLVVVVDMVLVIGVDNYLVVVVDMFLVIGVDNYLVIVVDIVLVVMVDILLVEVANIGLIVGGILLDNIHEENDVIHVYDDVVYDFLNKFFNLGNNLYSTCFIITWNTSFIRERSNSLSSLICCKRRN